MKISKRQLKRIIREEQAKIILEKNSKLVLSENWFSNFASNTSAETPQEVYDIIFEIMGILQNHGKIADSRDFEGALDVLEREILPKLPHLS